MHWMLMPLRRYADFTGRSRRQEYWMFVLFNLLVELGFGAVLGIVMLILYNADVSEDMMMTVCYIMLVPYILFVLYVIVPGLAVTVRRLPDTDRSGWAILFGLIPLVGGIILLVFYCTPGTAGPNRFGPDPIQGDQSAQVFS